MTDPPRLPPRSLTARFRPEAAEPYDPLRVCIYTTIGIIAWLITPAATVAIFGSIGVASYIRARRAGLASSRCLLGDTRLVIAYLGTAAAAGWFFTVRTIAGWIG